MARLIFVFKDGSDKCAGHLAGSGGAGQALTLSGEVLLVFFDRRVIDQRCLYLTKKGSSSRLCETDKLETLFDSADTTELMLELHGEAEQRVPSTSPFHRLPDGTMPPMFHEILDSAVIGMYQGDEPTCVAVFVSKTHALTVEHDAKPHVGDVLHGRSAPNPAGQRAWSFRVAAVSAEDDLVVLERTAGPEPVHVLALGADRPIGGLRDAMVVVATFGIAAAAKAGDKAGAISLGSFTSHTTIQAVGTRHFAYQMNSGRGDSGGAVISLAGTLLGLHMGGWNDADSPPPSPETPAEGAAGGASSRDGDRASKRRKKEQMDKERRVAMGLEDVGEATRRSVYALAKHLSTGGYAIFLRDPRVHALCSAILDS